MKTFRTKVFKTNLSRQDCQVTKEVKEFILTHSKNDTYLYNNRIMGLIGKEQYNVNHAFIKNYQK